MVRFRRASKRGTLTLFSIRPDSRRSFGIPLSSWETQVSSEIREQREKKYRADLAAAKKALPPFNARDVLHTLYQTAALYVESMVEGDTFADIKKRLHEKQQSPLVNPLFLEYSLGGRSIDRNDPILGEIQCILYAPRGHQYIAKDVRLDTNNGHDHISLILTHNLWLAYPVEMDERNIPDWSEQLGSVHDELVSIVEEEGQEVVRVEDNSIAFEYHDFKVELPSYRNGRRAITFDIGNILVASSGPNKGRVVAYNIETISGRKPATNVVELLVAKD